MLELTCMCCPTPHTENLVPHLCEHITPWLQSVAMHVLSYPPYTENHVPHLCERSTLWRQSAAMRGRRSAVSARPRASLISGPGRRPQRLTQPR